MILGPGVTSIALHLSVPIIAAFGGALLLSEDVTARLPIASKATLGGFWLVLARGAKAADVR